MPVVSNRVSKIELSQSRVASTGWIPMVFKRIGDSPFAAGPTWTFGMTVFYVIQDHPVYIPCGQRWPLRPELAAPLVVWRSSQLAQCASGRAGWQQLGAVAVLLCCTAAGLCPLDATVLRAS